MDPKQSIISATYQSVGDLESFFSVVETSLFDPSNINAIHYKLDSPLEESAPANEDLLKGVSGKNIVYCIWCSRDEHEWDKVYLGQVRNNLARQRIRNHLFKKHAKTGAKLENVQRALSEGMRLGFSCVQINPGYLRTSAEEYLIKKWREQLPWNIQGKQ